MNIPINLPYYIEEDEEDEEGFETDFSVYMLQGVFKKKRFCGWLIIERILVGMKEAS